MNLTLPHDEHVAAVRSQAPHHPSISATIAKNLSRPEFRVGLGSLRSPVARFVAVPETSVDKYRDLGIGEIDVGTPEYLFWLCDRVVPEAVKEVPNPNLGL